jgi:hypothetical protein
VGPDQAANRYSTRNTQELSDEFKQTVQNRTGNCHIIGSCVSAVDRFTLYAGILSNADHDGNQPQKRGSDLWNFLYWYTDILLYYDVLFDLSDRIKGFVSNHRYPE